MRERTIEDCEHGRGIRLSKIRSEYELTQNEADRGVNYVSSADGKNLYVDADYVSFLEDELVKRMLYDNIPEDERQSYWTSKLS